MHSKTTIRTISLVGALVLAATTARAVDPPPDGGYPNQKTAEGEDALLSLTTGTDNTAIGFQALLRNTIGNDNTAVGWDTLISNTSGSENTSVGFFALPNNTLGNDNTAVGSYALTLNKTGNDNIAIGVTALGGNGSGSRNIAIGKYAGLNLTTGSDNIDIGNQGVASEFGAIRIGNASTHRATFIAGISGVTAANGIPVLIGSNGRLGTTTSSIRFKDAVRSMDKASEAILLLQPVTFRYKHELDPDGIPQFGLVAEQVEKVNPDLVARDEQGKPYTVRYEAVNAMLLNEFLKEHRKVEEQGQKERAAS